ncbi:MAG: hypothetical protein M1416_01400 [Candidatus Pacearchaeota archaeon]|nr:hypothetical protein [Candidatus Pacearchaeota archaeon]
MDLKYNVIEYNHKKPVEKLNQLMKTFFERVEIDANFNVPLEVYWDNNMVNIRPSENFPHMAWGFEIKDDGLENRLYNTNQDKIIRTDTLCYTLLRVKGQEYCFEHKNRFKD